jgi:hypothetical protein
MSAGLNISGAVDILLLQDYAFTNNFKKNTDNASILNNRQPIAKPEFYNRLLCIIFRRPIVSSASARTSQKYSLAELQKLPH